MIFFFACFAFDFAFVFVFVFATALALAAGFELPDNGTQALGRGTAFTAIANDGTIYRPRLIKQIEDRSGNVVKAFPIETLRTVTFGSASGCTMP